MKLSTKLAIIIAILYNGAMGYFVTLTAAPLMVIAFLSIDFFLIFYYLWLLMRQNFGVMKFKIENRDLIKKARQELESETRS